MQCGKSRLNTDGTLSGINTDRKIVQSHFNNVISDFLRVVVVIG